MTPDGDFAGGIIMPGMSMQAEALYRQTAKLPRVTPKRPKRVVGRTTINAIRSGVFWGYVSAVDGMIDRIRAEIGADWPVVGTGSYAATIAAESPKISHVETDLTLHGLRIIWDFNNR